MRMVWSNTPLRMESTPSKSESVVTSPASRDDVIERTGSAQPSSVGLVSSNCSRADELTALLSILTLRVRVRVRVRVWVWVWVWVWVGVRAPARAQARARARPDRDGNWIGGAHPAEDAGLVGAQLGRQAAVEGAARWSSPEEYGEWQEPARMERDARGLTMPLVTKAAWCCRR